MFHLTRYKYIFFGISLAVIVPGLLALIFWGLNLGIDFTGGSTVNVVFASNSVTADQVQQVMVKDKAQDVNVLATRPLEVKNTPAPDLYVYITFDHPIGANISAEVLKRVQKLDSGAVITKTMYTVAYPSDTKTPTAQMVILFDKAVKTDDIKAALQNLPKSDPPPVETTSTATPTANATASATGSTTATAGATATAAPTATATATPTTTADQHAVKWTDVTPGANNQTYQINTQTAYNAKDVNNITSQLIHEFGPAYSSNVDSVSGSVSSDTTRDAILAVLFASGAILLYIGIAFRKVGSLRQSFRFGASAIIALLHDALVVLGLWAIFGHFFGFKVDSLFLTAVLTVIGFSVHDTIVVFDRIRENMGRRTAESFDTVVNASLVQTMTRSLNTSLTVLFTLAALTLFGGESIREFTLALLIGIASGTFSSIFNASMILDVWETGEYKRWFRRKPIAPAQQAKPKRELVKSR
ncbi:MAG TPA: protein translocase subunit SecF [Ktedonobacterales bacterium]|nr:protein translocase subunit SecF [Ktedonobacterales bacterium]